MARKKVEPKFKEVTLHQHDLANYLMCPRRFALSRSYKPRVLKKALNIGDLFARSVYWLHEGKGVEECMLYINKFQEELLNRATSQEQVDELETSVVVAQSMILGYEAKFIKEYKPVMPIITRLVPENRFEMEIINGGYKFTYVNRLDGLVYDQFDNPWVLELKTTSMFDKSLFDKLPTNFQINSYWLAAEYSLKRPVAGVLYRYILKPLLRQKKNESLDQYRQRIMLDYTTYPDEYMKETSIFFSKPNLEEFKKDMNIYFGELVRSLVLNRWEKRGTACENKFGLCDYIKYCGDPVIETLETFYERIG